MSEVVFKTFETHTEHGDHRQFALRNHGSHGEKTLPTGAIALGGKALTARCYRGMWIVDCPCCGGAELAAESGVFFCCGCRNADFDGAFLRTKFPPHRAAIERALAVRPTVNCNWNFGEQAQDLRAENKRYGLPQEA